MEIRFRELEIGFAVHGQCGAYIKEYCFLHTLWIVHEQFMCDSSSTVMRADEEGGETPVLHYSSTITCHERLGVLCHA